MKKLTPLVLSYLSFQVAFSQSADELNKSSKDLLQQGKLQEASLILRKAAELGNAVLIFFAYRNKNNGTNLKT